MSSKPSDLRGRGARRASGKAGRRVPAGSGRRPPAAGRGLGVALLLVTLLVVSITALASSGEVRPRIQSRLNPLKYENEIGRAAARHRVDPYLVAAVARAESGYDPAAVSPAGAVGIMQIMPATAAWIVQLDDWPGGPVGDLTDPAVNLDLGAFYLAFLIDLFGGDVRSALAAYNAGQGTVSTWLDGAGGGRPSLEPADIPFPETRDFVERVERFRTIYRKAHPNAFLT